MSNDIPNDFYCDTKSTIRFVVPNRFQLKEYLGSGANGDVVRAVARSNNADEVGVTIKKLYYPFDPDCPARSQRLYRELKLLQSLNHDNVVKFVSAYTPDTSFETFNNVYIVTKYAGLNLKYIIQNGSNIVNNDHRRHIIYQILAGLKYLHSADVIHRDLKPSNIAVDVSSVSVRILDFGLARAVTNTKGMTAYVMSRFYRSPEVMYWERTSYNAKVDMWSVGCILAELYTHTVLFRGADNVEQFKFFIQFCGPMGEDLMARIEQYSKPTADFIRYECRDIQNKRDEYINNFRRSGMEASAIHLLENLIVMDPEKRFSVQEALEHEYFNGEHDDRFEPTYTGEKITTGLENGDYKTAVWNELQQIQQNESIHFCAY